MTVQPGLCRTWSEPKLFVFSCTGSVSYYNLSNVCLFVCLFVCSPTPPRSLGRTSPNSEGRWRTAPDISLRGSFFKRSRSSRSKVKFMLFFFSVCSPTSPRYPCSENKGAKLICAFVFAYADCWFSHVLAHIETLS